MGEQRPFWRQPLFHFLVAGAAIFAVSALRGEAPTAESRRIVISQTEIARIAGLWSASWGRTPNDGELKALIDDRVKEEIFYREAVRLGLDADDAVIRQRLRQKMEFIAEAEIRVEEPSESALRDYYEEHAAQYTLTAAYSFSQIYLKNWDADRAGALLTALNEGRDASSDPIGLPPSMTDANRNDIARTFGEEFYAALAGLDVGDWRGPIKSGFGFHLVKITEIWPASTSSFDAVRERVRSDWLASERSRIAIAAYEKLRQKYQVVIENEKE